MRIGNGYSPAREEFIGLQTPAVPVRPSIGVVFYFLLGITGVILLGVGAVLLARTDSFRDLFSSGPLPASVETVSDSLDTALVVLGGVISLALANWIWQQKTIPQQLAMVAARVSACRLTYAIILLVSHSLVVLALGLVLSIVAAGTVGKIGVALAGIGTAVLIIAVAVTNVRPALGGATATEPPRGEGTPLPEDTDVSADAFETNLVDYLRADHGLLLSPVGGAYSDYWQLSFQGTKLKFAVLAGGRQGVVPTGVRWILRIEGELSADLGRLLAESFRAGSMRQFARHQRVQYKSIDLLPDSRLAMGIVLDTESAPIHPAELIDILAKSQDTNDRRRAAFHWRQIGPESAEHVPDLLAILDQGDDISRRLALEALGRIGKPAAAATHVLADMWQRGELKSEVGAALKRIAPGLLQPLI